MADIFLSYSEEDREVVRRLADALQSIGWAVWWDRRIPAGSTWRKVLARELQEMRCMVVLWSTHSVQSEWVCEEADEGRLRNCLMPAMIEQVRPPAGFREVQAADLIDWDGSRDFLGLQRLIEDIERLIGKPAPERTASQTLPHAAPNGEKITQPRPKRAAPSKRTLTKVRHNPHSFRINCCGAPRHWRCR